jgi:hypothetical protein
VDKSVYGVISGITNTRKFDDDKNLLVDSEGNSMLNEYLKINSLGEGAVWISNYSGNLENGDYITSSPIPGIGMKQSDDVLHNYTVAKITMDCNFDDDTKYKLEEVEYDGVVYMVAFVGCTYHCG